MTASPPPPSSPPCATCHCDLSLCVFARCSQECFPDNRFPSCNRCALEQRCFVDEPLLHTEAQRTVHHAFAPACAMNCNLKPDLDQCATTCSADYAGLSAGCRDCCAQLVACAGMRCASFCDQGLNPGWCAECMRFFDCYLPFYVCTGLLPDRPRALRGRTPAPTAIVTLPGARG